LHLRNKPEARAREAVVPSLACASGFSYCEAAAPAQSLPPDGQALGQVVTFVGAGIYEELLFRLLRYSRVTYLLRLTMIGPLGSSVLAAVASALIFSFAHHIGPHGENFQGYVFLFRTLAGLYFAVLYQLRGFGIAVGAHTCYDVLVGVALG